MIRFVDLRFQGIQSRFALWDTVGDCFLEFRETQAWEDWKELEADLDGYNHLIKHFRELCPPWVFEPATDEELDFRRERFSED